MYPAERRLCRTAAPTDPSRVETPITATDAGRSTLRHGRRRGDVVALLEPSARLVPELGRELDLELARQRSDLDGEPGVAEHLDHPVVVREHDGGEGVDAVGARELGQVREQHGGDAAALPLVGDLERDLGAAGRRADVGGVGDDALRVAGDGDEPAAVLGLQLRHVPRGPVQVGGRAEEPQPARVDRESVEEARAAHPRRRRRSAGRGRSRRRAGRRRPDGAATVTGAGVRRAWSGP